MIGRHLARPDGGVIDRGGGLPWPPPADLRRVKREKAGVSWGGDGAVAGEAAR